MHTDTHSDDVHGAVCASFDIVITGQHLHLAGIIDTQNVHK